MWSFHCAEPAGRYQHLYSTANDFVVSIFVALRATNSYLIEKNKIKIWFTSSCENQYDNYNRALQKFQKLCLLTVGTLTKWLVSIELDIANICVIYFN